MLLQGGQWSWLCGHFLSAWCGVGNIFAVVGILYAAGCGREGRVVRNLMSVFRFRAAIQRSKRGWTSRKEGANSTMLTYTRLLRVPSPTHFTDLQYFSPMLLPLECLFLIPHSIPARSYLSPLKHFLTSPFAPVVNKFNCTLLCTSTAVIYEPFSRIHPWTASQEVLSNLFIFGRQYFSG